MISFSPTKPLCSLIYDHLNVNLLSGTETSGTIVTLRSLELRVAPSIEAPI